MFLFFF
ncbi:Glutathione S-transferase GSTU6 [Zea mays]|nr:Glutathione S-transferase GSTU6 [Zea mays]